MIHLHGILETKCEMECFLALDVLNSSIFSTHEGFSYRDALRIMSLVVIPDRLMDSCAGTRPCESPLGISITRFNRMFTISRRNSLCSTFLLFAISYNRQLYTNRRFMEFMHKGQYHFSPWIWGRKSESALSTKITPPIDSLQSKTLDKVDLTSHVYVSLHKVRLWRDTKTWRTNTTNCIISKVALYVSTITVPKLKSTKSH